MPKVTFEEAIRFLLDEHDELLEEIAALKVRLDRLERESRRPFSRNQKVNRHAS